jgi:hypothetical protein
VLTGSYQGDPSSFLQLPLHQNHQGCRMYQDVLLFYDYGRVLQKII